MMPVIPAVGMMVIAMIVMGLVTARQGKSHNEREDPNVYDVSHPVFHDKCFIVYMPKPCHPLKIPPKWYSLRKEPGVIL
jgi:hypothetical protein